jgi:hypothetical protein
MLVEYAAHGVHVYRKPEFPVEYSGYLGIAATFDDSFQELDMVRQVLFPLFTGDSLAVIVAQPVLGKQGSYCYGGRGHAKTLVKKSRYFFAASSNDFFAEKTYMYRHIDFIHVVLSSSTDGSLIFPPELPANVFTLI